MHTRHADLPFRASVAAVPAVHASMHAISTWPRFARRARVAIPCTPPFKRRCCCGGVRAPLNRSPNGFRTRACPPRRLACGLGDTGATTATVTKLISNTRRHACVRRRTYQTNHSAATTSPPPPTVTPSDRGARATSAHAHSAASVGVLCIYDRRRCTMLDPFHCIPCAFSGLACEHPDCRRNGYAREPRFCAALGAHACALRVPSYGPCVPCEPVPVIRVFKPGAYIRIFFVSLLRRSVGHVSVASRQHMCSGMRTTHSSLS